MMRRRDDGKIECAKMWQVREGRIRCSGEFQLNVCAQQQDREQRKLYQNLHESRGSRCCIADGNWTASPS